MSSTRLPGKALIDIAGKPLISHVVERAKRIKNMLPPIIATSEDKSDDVLEEYANANGLLVYRGALEDVAMRALQCAESFGLDAFVRICGDRPFFDPGIVDKLLHVFLSMDLDLATNVQVKTFPPGMSAEIISVESFKRVCSMTDEMLDREHITKYYYAHLGEFNMQNIESDNKENSNVSLVIDTEADLERCRWIAKQLKDNAIVAPSKTIIKLAKEWNEKL